MYASYKCTGLKCSRVVCVSVNTIIFCSVLCGHIRIDNSSFERVEEFKYLGTTLTNQNSIHEEVKSSLKSGNACYYSVQNL
jgi:UDP-galactopyranose mutase